LSRDLSHRIRILALCSAILLARICSRPANAAQALNFPPSDFDILSADTGELIGNGHYTVDQTASEMTLHGENRYRNGQYDLEEDKLRVADDRPLPVLNRYYHNFFNADGSPSMSSRVDMETGLGVCGTAVAGKLDFVSAKLKMPDDTYAGSSGLLPIQQVVRDGGDEILKLQVFNCAPTPKVIAVDVKPQPRTQAWPRIDLPIQWPAQD